MKFLLLALLFAAVLLPAAEPNLIIDPATGKLRGRVEAAGVTAELRDGAGFITVDGANRQYRMPIPVPEGVKSLRVKLRLRADGVTPGKEGWQNARLAMRFYSADGKGVGPWPDVFSAKGDSGWIDCERVYAVPEGAASLMLEPANFGTAGKAEFADLRVEAAWPAATSAAVNLIVNPATGKLRAGNPPAGITAELRDGAGFITVDGANRQLNLALPIEPGVKFIRIRMRMRVSDVVPGKESWQDARLAMRFHGADGKGVGPWPEVFHGKGSGGWVDCDRLFAVPEGATSLTLGPANFGTAGKVEFADLRVEAVSNVDSLDRDAMLPPGLTMESIAVLEDAWRVVTPSRERISLNGLWRFRPLLPGEQEADIPPAGSGWGYFKVPGAWPIRENGMKFHLSPLMAAALKPDALNSAWYLREIEVPSGWAGRKILLTADMIQSCAKIFVDGKEAAELYYPGGEADLTGKLIPGKKQTLALLVSANPVESANFMAPERLIKLATALSNRGITGDLYLDSRPVAASVSDVHVITSVRNQTVDFDTGFVTLPAGSYRLAAEISDAADGKTVKRFESKVFQADGKPGFRYTFSEKWNDAKLWDTDTPENLYVAKLRLLDAKGTLLDEFLPQEFGFREFYVEGRDFYLNGKKIHLRMLVTKTPQESDFGADAWVEHLVESSRNFGANFLIGWNYSFAPGVFCYPDSFHKGTSKRGMLTSLTLPHFKDFAPGLEKPEQAAAYRRQAEHLIRRYQNVPGVVMNVMNHNATGYMGDQNPQRLGTSYRPEQALPAGALRNRAQAEIAEKIAKTLDPVRPVYHHESGNLGDVFTLNCYLNWSPRQERGDWLENWSKEGVMPVMFVEWGLPHVASWSSFRGPAFIWRNAGLQCLWVNEFNAAILGEDAYRNEPAKENLYAHQEKMIKGNRETFFSALGGNNILNQVEDVNRVRAYYADRVFRNLRWWGISGLLPWDQFLCWSWVSNGEGSRDNPDALRDLKRPGVVPDRILARGEHINNPVGEYRLNTTGKSVHAGFTEFLGWVGGKPGEITEEGHNFRSGETVKKTLVMLNDSRREAEIDWRWRIPALGLEKSGRSSVAPGGKFEQPLEFRVPADAPKQFELTAEFDFPGQGKTTDRFMFDHIASAKAKLALTVGLYDPEGKAGEILKRIGVDFRPVRSDADLNGIGLLVIGRHGLREFPLHLAKRLENGLKLLVLEQSYPELERLGLRGTEHDYREVFSAANGFRDLRDWRGSATLLPGALAVQPYEATNPKWDWNGFDNTRVWRAGNRGGLSEVSIEKPPVGNWNPLLNCGFDLQYAPLIEFAEGKGRIVFCQLSVTGRTESDPEADELVRLALERLDGAVVPQRREVFYLGGAEGKALLETLRIPFRPYEGGALSADSLLVLATGAKPADLKKAVEAGANVLALGLDKAALDAALPGGFRLTPGDYSSDYVDGLKKVPEFAGIGNAELHWRGKISFDAFDAGTPGGLALGIARPGKGAFVAVQLPPWKFDEKEFYNRTTRRRSAFLVSRLLANLGAGAESGFFAQLDGYRGNLKYDLPNDRWIGLADPNGEGRSKGWMKPEFRIDSKWRSVRVPGNFDTQFADLAGYDGLFWYRLEFDLPKEFADEECELLLGAIDDESWTWLNGHFLGEVTKQTNPKDYWQFPRLHAIKPGVLKPGKNVLVVLCNDTFNYGGILGTPRLKVPVKHGFYADIPEASDDPYRYYRW